MCLKKEDSEERRLDREKVSGRRDHQTGPGGDVSVQNGCYEAVQQHICQEPETKYSRLYRPPGPCHHSPSLLVSAAGKQPQTAVNKGVQQCPTPFPCSKAFPST